MHPKLRVILFLTVLNGATAASAWLWLDSRGWLWALPIALSINFLWWTYDHVLTFSRFEGERLLGQDRWGVLKVVNELSERFRMVPPRIYVLDDAHAQVFCYAKTGRHPRVHLTRGALELLNARELRAALTFQMCVANSSIGFLNYWMAALVDLLWRAGRVLERAVALVFGWAPPLAKYTVAPWIWALQVVLMSPRDFAKLDRETSARLQNPADLASAMWKLHAYAETEPWPEPWVLAHMCMVSPLSRRFGLRALSVQPPLARRIENLVGHYPP